MLSRLVSNKSLSRQSMFTVCSSFMSICAKAPEENSGWFCHFPMQAPPTPPSSTSVTDGHTGYKARLRTVSPHPACHFCAPQRNNMREQDSNISDFASLLPPLLSVFDFRDTQPPRPHEQLWRNLHLW